MLATCSADFTCKVWDFNEFLCTKVRPPPPPAMQHCSAGTVQSQYIHARAGICGRGLILLAATVGGAALQTLKGHEHNVSSVRFLPSDDVKLLSASRDCTVKLWDSKTGAPPPTIQLLCL